MSHIVRIKTEVRDEQAICSACQRLKLQPPVLGSHELFSGRVDGLAIQLSGWKYPVVVQVDTGELQYDNFEGRWGEQQKLGGFVQAYAIEKASIESRRRGHSVTEQALPDGSVKLSIRVGGAA